MGCHSGKVAVPITVAAPATVEGTLLAPEVAPEKEPSTPEKEVAEKTAEHPSKAVASMIVIDSGKLYSNYEGIARALDVYHRGWLPAFNDVKNGDTGEVLGEVDGHQPAVALKLHRNGAVVCIAKQGVEAAGLNGVWNGGEINGDKLTWMDGTVTQMRIDGMTRVFSVTFDGNPYTAEHHADDTIHWSDGDVWTRYLGEKEVQPVKDAAPLPSLPAACAAATGTLQTIAEMAAAEESRFGFPEIYKADDSRQSTVPEETDKNESSDAARGVVGECISSECGVGSRNKRPVHENPCGVICSSSPAPTQEAEMEPLSSQRALFAMTAKMQSEASAGADDTDGQSASEKRGRRERKLCCC